jgi:hypothetical protein
MSVLERYFGSSVDRDVANRPYRVNIMIDAQHLVFAYDTLINGRNMLPNTFYCKHRTKFVLGRKDPKGNMVFEYTTSPTPEQAC